MASPPNDEKTLGVLVLGRNHFTLREISASSHYGDMGHYVTRIYCLYCLQRKQVRYDATIQKQYGSCHYKFLCTIYNMYQSVLIIQKGRMMKRVIQYQAKDGSMHNTELDAKLHENKIHAIEALKMVLLSSLSTMRSDAILKQIIESQAEIREILLAYNKRLPKVKPSKSESHLQKAA